MKKINIKILPSIVTLGNLFCGFLAVAYIADNRLSAAAWLIFVGMIFDMLDGKVARLTKGSSDFGMQLDSLADMITFGVAPAFLMKIHILQKPSPCPDRVVWVLCLLFVICAALRLARFNVESDHDESAHLYFKGLATPAAAGVLASLALTFSWVTLVFPVIYYKIFMLANIFILGALMVSHIRYVHIGIQLLKKRRQFADLAALVFFVALVAIEPQIFTITLCTSFFLYAFWSPVRELYSLSIATFRKTDLSKISASETVPVGFEDQYE